MRRFEDLDVWQVSRELVKEIYSLTYEDSFRRDFAFVDQIRRAAVSTMNNIAEGFERGSDNDFARFLFIARGSVGEIRSLLYVALDQNYTDKREFERLCNLCVRSSQMIWGLIKYLKTSKPSKTTKSSKS